MMQGLFVGTLGFDAADGGRAACWLQVFHDPAGDRPTVVILTDLERTPGEKRGSPFLVADRLATRVSRHFVLDAETVLWIEHLRYNDPAVFRRDAFWRVHFKRIEPHTEGWHCSEPGRVSTTRENLEGVIAPRHLIFPTEKWAGDRCLELR